MTDERRSIELEVEVSGSPEEVWRAIATGPGISSWYVPHVVEERENGTAVATFGEGPEMEIPGRVRDWEPPKRIVFDGGEGVEGLAFEWTVEARDGGTCVVRLVNSGFGSGSEWDDQFDGMTEGWSLFLTNLRLHLEHFGGSTASSMLPAAVWVGPRSAAWDRLCSELSLDRPFEVGSRITIAADEATSMHGTVVEWAEWRIAILLDGPVPGTAFLAAEGDEAVNVSIWTYLYGPEAEPVCRRDVQVWQQWLDARS